MINQNDLAYPDFSGRNDGLTKRELFSILILQGLISRIGYGDYEASSVYAIRQADALIRQLNKTEQSP